LKEDPVLPKPVALPQPRQAELAARATLEAFGPTEVKLDDLVQRRNMLALELGLVDAEIDVVASSLPEAICGGADDSQEVEKYDGSLGVTREFVDTHEPRIGQLQWLEDLHDRFSGPGDSAGSVAGVRWGSGGLIANDLFISAGHCFDQQGGGHNRPSRGGKLIESDEIATLMRVNFNYQVNGQTGETRPGEAFPVEELLECKIANLDFAIVRVGTNAAGRLPGETYGTLAIAAEDLITNGAMLCLIQHPKGDPKRIEAGPMSKNEAGQIHYDSLDTLNASSGSPILSDSGEVVGVHTNGGCSFMSGSNFGVAIGAIRNASSIVE
jgi:V8-like Glu-specific endopeptidase